MPVIDISKARVKTGSIYPAPWGAEMAGRSSIRLGEAGGLTQFGANLVILEPGAKSSLRHWHRSEDEFVMVRLRFYNDGSEPASLVIDPAIGYESFAISAGGETLHILREGNGDLAAKKRLDLDVRPGAMESWWALFPALPAGTETFDLVVPPAPPFEAVPVSAQ